MNVLGASVREDTVTFAVWAPRCRSVEVAMEGRRPQPMTRGADDVFTLTMANVAPGTRYRYRLDGERYRPDPTARWQPEGVHGPSAVVDSQRFLWTDEDFRGHAPGDLVIYELHVGTFTAAGTFEAIIQHLPALVDLGVTAVQLMPVVQFPGSRNWGYDGVHLYAFRLDAIHAIHDASPVHILTEFAEAVHEEGARGRRRVHVIAESHDNDRRLVLAPAEGGLGLDAIWSDDFHHALHHQLTGETAGYYADFTGDHHLPRAIAEGFAFQGEPSQYWGRPRGTVSRDLSPARFVIFVQNHDQVGNRAQAARLSTLVPFAAVKLAAGLLFAAPAVPLLFMVLDEDH